MIVGKNKSGNASETDNPSRRVNNPFLSKEIMSLLMMIFNVEI
jgi:hypothetical protein